MMDVRRIEAGDRDAVLAFLERAPYENAFLAWMLTSESLVLHAPIYVAWDGKRVAGMLYLGPQIVIAGASDAARAALAELLVRSRRPSLLVGTVADVEYIESMAREAFGEPPVVRACQPVYALTPQQLRPAPHARVRRAEFADLEMVAYHAAAMTAEELGFDPRRADFSSFREGTRRNIERGWSWVWTDEGQLRFKVSIGAVTARTTQLQGVFTPPEYRGRGYASAGLHAVCQTLFEEGHPTLSLCVNDFNHTARRLYERLGFTEAGALRTLIYLPQNARRHTAPHLT
ncbi:GNAT family N-acetyltransferase [bacterium]|nr:MAG: GNAT family N-acetyltransferase [bacterium]